MAGNLITFTGITRERFNQIVARIEAQIGNVGTVGDSGEASKEGFEVKWSFDERSAILTVQCVKKPLFFTEGLVDAKIRQLVEGQ